MDLNAASGPMSHGIDARGRSHGVTSTGKRPTKVANSTLMAKTPKETAPVGRLFRPGRVAPNPTRATLMPQPATKTRGVSERR